MDIEQIFYGLTTTLSLALAVLTLQRLLSGWWRRYYLLVGLLVLLLASVVPSIATYVSNGNWTISAQKIYWTLALSSQLTIFLFVLQLIFRVGKELPNHAVLVRALTFVAVAAAGLSVLIHFDKRPNAFMTAVTRDLTFLAAILNLVLWRFLIQLRKRDFLLLAVSAGLGIQCTGDAIGHSLRMLAREAGVSSAFHDFGNIIMSLTAVMTLAVWHTAFSRSKYKVEEKQPVQAIDGSIGDVSSRNSNPVR